MANKLYLTIDVEDNYRGDPLTYDVYFINATKLKTQVEQSTSSSLSYFNNLINQVTDKKIDNLTITEDYDGPIPITLYELDINCEYYVFIRLTRDVVSWVSQGNVVIETIRFIHGTPNISRTIKVDFFYHVDMKFRGVPDDGSVAYFGTKLNLLLIDGLNGNKIDIDSGSITPNIIIAKKPNGYNSFDIVDGSFSNSDTEDIYTEYNIGHVKGFISAKVSPTFRIYFSLTKVFHRGIEQNPVSLQGVPLNATFRGKVRYTDYTGNHTIVEDLTHLTGISEPRTIHYYIEIPAGKTDLRNIRAEILSPFKLATNPYTLNLFEFNNTTTFINNLYAPSVVHEILLGDVSYGFLGFRLKAPYDGVVATSYLDSVQDHSLSFLPSPPRSNTIYKTPIKVEGTFNVSLKAPGYDTFHSGTVTFDSSDLSSNDTKWLNYGNVIEFNPNGNAILDLNLPTIVLTVTDMNKSSQKVKVDYSLEYTDIEFEHPVTTRGILKEKELNLIFSQYRKKSQSMFVSGYYQDTSIPFPALVSLGFPPIIITTNITISDIASFTKYNIDHSKVINALVIHLEILEGNVNIGSETMRPRSTLTNWTTLVTNRAKSKGEEDSVHLQYFIEESEKRLLEYFDFSENSSKLTTHNNKVSNPHTLSFGDMLDGKIKGSYNVNLFLSKTTFLSLLFSTLEYYFILKVTFSGRYLLNTGSPYEFTLGNQFVINDVFLFTGDTVTVIVSSPDTDTQLFTNKTFTYTITEQDIVKKEIEFLYLTPIVNKNEIKF